MFSSDLINMPGCVWPLRDHRNGGMQIVMSIAATVRWFCWVVLHSTLKTCVKDTVLSIVLLLTDGINKIIFKGRLLTSEMLLAVSLFFLANMGPDI